jgi:hypothetical protein
MTWFEVLVEGASDMPAVREVLTRRFGLVETEHFRMHPHRGRGRLPVDLISPPPLDRRGLLDQLPAKLRGFSYLTTDACVLVVLDVDDDPCEELLSQLQAMLARLPRRPPRVLFRLAIEETESWFIADRGALQRAYPRAKLQRLGRRDPDAIIGAWERLAHALDVDTTKVTGATKFAWAERIAPHLELTAPPSPSLQKLVEGIERELAGSQQARRPARRKRATS